MAEHIDTEEALARAFQTVAEGDLARHVLEIAGLAPPTSQDVATAFQALEAAHMCPLFVKLAPEDWLFLPALDDRSLLLALLAADYVGKQQTPRLSAALLELGLRMMRSTAAQSAALRNAVQVLPWACFLTTLTRHVDVGQFTPSETILESLYRVVHDLFEQGRAAREQEGGPDPGGVALAAMRTVLRLLHDLFDFFTPAEGPALNRHLQQVQKSRRRLLDEAYIALHPFAHFSTNPANSIRHPVIYDARGHNPVVDAMPSLLDQELPIIASRNLPKNLDFTAAFPGPFYQRMYKAARQLGQLAPHICRKFVTIFMKTLELEALKQAFDDAERMAPNMFSESIDELVGCAGGAYAHTDPALYKSALLMVVGAGYPLPTVAAARRASDDRMREPLVTVLQELLDEAAAAR